MAERKNGAGGRLSGVLERSTPLDQAEDNTGDPDVAPVEGEPAEPSRGRGASPRKPTKPPEPRAAKRIRGRTIYLPDDLFERILVQAHRRNKTISDYVAAILDRQVPDHRVVRAEPTDGTDAA